jgi:hypothetical protein
MAQSTPTAQLISAPQQTNWGLAPETLAALQAAQAQTDLLRWWPAFWERYNQKVQAENAMRHQMWQQLFMQAQQLNRPYFNPMGEAYYPQIPNFPYAQPFQAQPFPAQPWNPFWR